MDHAVRLVTGVDQFAEALVFLSVRLGVAHHPLDFLFIQAARGLDDDLLLFPAGLVLRRHVQNTVRVDVERHLDLRHSARLRRNVREIKLAERLVISRTITLAL